MGTEKEGMLKWLVRLASNLSLMVIGLGFVVSCQPLFIEEVEKASPSRQVTSNDFGWQESWRRSIQLSYGVLPRASVVDNKILMPIGRDQDVTLSALDTKNGLTLWIEKLDSPYGGVDSINADATQVYVAVPFTIRSFRVADGTPLWTTDNLQAHTVYSILPPQNTGVVQAETACCRYDVTRYNISVQNGEIRSTATYTLVPQLQTKEATYYLNNMFDLLSVDNQTGQTLWQARIGPLGGLEIIDTKVLIVLSGPYLKSLSGIAPLSGKELWQTPEQNIASNFVVISNTIYAINKDATITAYDALTGREVGRMTFSGGPLDVDHAAQYWLIAGDSKMFVYLGDSQELIAFDLP